MTGSVGLLPSEPYEGIDTQRCIGIQPGTEIKQDAVVLSHDSVNPDSSRIPVSVHDTDARSIEVPGDAMLSCESLQLGLRI